MQAASGNSVDTVGFKKIIKSHIKSLKAAQACRYFIGDAALYVAESIQSLDEQKQHFISRVPQKILQAKQLITAHKAYQFEPLGNGYRGVWVDSDYAEVKQRWLLLHSEQAEQRAQHTLNKTILKSTMTSHKTFKKLCQRRYACEQDAKKAMKEWEGSQDYISVGDPQVIPVEFYAKSGRPKLGEVPLRIEYQLIGQLYCELIKREQIIAQKGLFILATNDCSGGLTMEKMLSLYKSQQSVEKGFRFLKSPDFLTSSLYLKKPERIEALLMIMTCCLMVYAALEHKIRHELKAKKLYFPDMKKKPGQSPTARWVFFCFQGIHELTIEGQPKRVLNLQERNLTIIDCLGDIYRQIYS
jgi:transposase